MRLSFALAAAIAILARAAVAQTPAPEPTAYGAAPSPPPFAKPKAGSDTLSGVTVMPQPKKTCSSRDKECIALVVAELKRLYPEQLKLFCFEEQTKAARNQFVYDQLWDPNTGTRPPIPHSFPVSAVVKTACAPDPKQAPIR